PGAEVLDMGVADGQHTGRIDQLGADFGPAPRPAVISGAEEWKWVARVGHALVLAFEVGLVQIDEAAEPGFVAFRVVGDGHWGPSIYSRRPRLVICGNQFRARIVYSLGAWQPMVDCNDCAKGGLRI